MRYDEGWMSEASCGRVAPAEADLAHGTTDEQRVFIARYCTGCPVKQECLDDEVPPDPFSVRGGLLPGERFEAQRLKNMRYFPPLPHANVRPGAAIERLLLRGFSTSEITEQLGCNRKAVERQRKRMQMARSA